MADKTHSICLDEKEHGLLRQYLEACGIWRSDDHEYELFAMMENDGTADARGKVGALLEKLGVKD